MPQSKLMELSYYDPKAEVRLTVYADTLMFFQASGEVRIGAVRFGGYPEMVQAMSDAIYAGSTVEVFLDDHKQLLHGLVKGYRRELSRDGVYATATLLASDDPQSLTKKSDEEDCRQEEVPQPRTCYLFCPSGEKDRLFLELDRKTAAPLIPAFRDYVLDALIANGDLRRMAVRSLRERLEAWVLTLKPDDQNVIDILETGLKRGAISIPGSQPGQADGFDEIHTLSHYLETFGTTVAQRIRSQFQPLFDPAAEPLSEEILTINRNICEKAGYSLFDAQLAVAEAVKRQLVNHKIALIRSDCGTGKTKIGAVALGALYGLHAAMHGGAGSKKFGVILAPAHVTKKWVREIAETLPNTYGMVVHSIAELNRLRTLYEQGDKTVYAVISKEKARDGYMRYPAVLWNKRHKTFLCPDCMEPLKMNLLEDGLRLLVPADQFFFLEETRENHKCPHCGTPLWSAVNPDRQTAWVKIGGYGWVYRHRANAHLQRTENAKVQTRLLEISAHPNDPFPTRGATRRYPLSTYIKKKMRGKLDALLADELHQYNNASGQGDAMAELYGTCKKFVGMTATLINGYSSGIFYLLYRIAPGLMRKDGQKYQKPGIFNAEYGVVQNIYEIQDAKYNSNRRSSKRKVRSRLLPGVSPLVFSRFLLENTVFLRLTDMGKDLPDYEEIPVPLAMPEDVAAAYQNAERILTDILRSDRKRSQKILSSYLGLLTVYPDQPYDQPPITDPFSETDLIVPENVGDFDCLLPKEMKTLEIVRAKIAAGERVLIYTSWTRTDSQKKLRKMLLAEGIRTEILTPRIPPEKREEWVQRRIANGAQVLITNPSCVETGLDLNAFTTLIFYSIGYNLFTLRQASLRSWRVNQTAPRIEVYLLYYAGTMQAKAMKLMASKLAAAGIIEGTFTDEGLAAMSEVQDLTSQMAKELVAGIRDNVEDIAAAYKRMAILNPDRKHTTSEPTETSLLETPDTPVVSQRPAAQAMQHAHCEDLLLKSMKSPRNKRSEKLKVDHDQLTFFDAA